VLVGVYRGFRCEATRPERANSALPMPHVGGGRYWEIAQQVDVLSRSTSRSECRMRPEWPQDMVDELAGADVLKSLMARL